MLHEIYYSLQLADNALIHGHRLSEWCGHGPVLEQDIALTNIALDHLGQARSFYQLAADKINELPEPVKTGLFASVALQEQAKTGIPLDEDDLAYLRDGWDFRNVLLVEQPNKDWAYTIARSFYYDTFCYYLYTDLQHTPDSLLAAIAEKSLKETSYHLRWSSEWVIRLGDGTPESHERMQEAIQTNWTYTAELMTPGTAERFLHQQGISPDLNKIRSLWETHIDTVLREATLTMPSAPTLPGEGKEGKHSEHLGYILAEMQFMQRAYPGMKW